MPTPYGSHGGMAFGAQELRVLRRALALALHPSPASAEDVQDCLRLADSVDEAVREGARLRAFVLADLGRYRLALPGAAPGYLGLLEEVLSAGYEPTSDDLAALGALRGNPVAAALLDRCRDVAEQAVRARSASRAAAVPGERRAAVPGARTRLLALPGGRAAADEGEEKPKPKPKPEPAAPAVPPTPGRPTPSRRPVPTPGEVFPPKRRPAPPANPPEKLAVG
ncbi:hypothetical protein ACWCP6_17500 [Streptomyces sp. NPDC002004]